MQARLSCLMLLATAGLAACGPSTGGSTTAHPPIALPPEQGMARIPLGAPPGAPLALATSTPNPYEGDPVAVAQGKALFSAMNCVYCHGAGGSGLMGPPLNAHGWRYGGAPAQIYNSIHDGRPQGMPAWGGSLPPDQVWKLVAYVESLGGALPPATAKTAALGASQPSGTGPQAAGQASEDAAQAGRIAANKASGG